MEGLAESKAVIVGVLALIVLVITIAAAKKNWRKGIKWLISLIIVAFMTYLLLSSEVL